MTPASLPQDVSMPSSARPSIAPAWLSEDPFAFAIRQAQLLAAQAEQAEEQAFDSDEDEDGPMLQGHEADSGDEEWE
jgi:hypothetical protein